MFPGDEILENRLPVAIGTACIAHETSWKSMVHALNIFWIPSVLAAWPAAWLIEEIRSKLGIETNKSLDGIGFSGMLVIDALTLTLIFLSMRTLHRNAMEHREESRWLALLASPKSCLAIWLLAQPLVLALLGLPKTLAHMSDATGSMAGMLLLASIPTVLFLLILFDRVGFRHLMGNTLGIVLAGVTLVMESMQWAIGQSPSPMGLAVWNNRGTEGAFWNDTLWLCVTLLSAGLATSWLLPYWVLWATSASSMEPTFAEHIRSLWRRAGVRPPRVLLWPTGCRLSNAAIVNGLGVKRLLITDRLLLNYTMHQIEWIVLHEIAHVNRYHSWVRLLPAWIAVPALFGSLQIFEGWVLVTVLLSVAIVFGVLIIATCWWTEMDADRTAIRLGSQWWGLSRDEAAARYIAVLQRIYGDNRTERTSWTHPSLKQRIAPYSNPVPC